MDYKNWSARKDTWTTRWAFGDTLTLSANKDAKSNAWLYVKANEFMLTDNKNAGKYIATVNNCVWNQTLASFFTKALSSPFPQKWDYKVCNVKKNFSYSPVYFSEPNWENNNYQSSNLALNHNQLVIWATDNWDTAWVISNYSASYKEADVWLGALEWVNNGYPAGFANSSYNLDIGWPTSCHYNDSECKSFYNATVYMWIK
jgi:hypothetical protein